MWNQTKKRRATITMTNKPVLGRGENHSKPEGARVSYPKFKTDNEHLERVKTCPCTFLFLLLGAGLVPALVW